MCLSNFKYPLVENLEDGKRKIMFQYPYEVKDRSAILEMDSYANDCDLACKGISRYVNMNKDFKGFKFIKLVSVPCGICEECKKDHAKQWALRILEEAKKYKHNYFITFTYDDDHLPTEVVPGTNIHNLVKDEISKFNKKLKTYLKRNGCDSKFRFYAVGEYGSHTYRPHYHGIYFNLDLKDLKMFAKSSHGAYYFESELLNDVWAKGNVVIGDVTMESAAYVARYCDKKKNLTPLERKNAKAKGIVPEFSVMSRRPGIGVDSLEKIKSNVENGIYKMVVNGTQQSIPLYYCNKLEEVLDPDDYARFKLSKERNASIKTLNDVANAEHAGLSLSEYMSIKRSESKEKVIKRK